MTVTAIPAQRPNAQRPQSHGWRPLKRSGWIVALTLLLAQLGHALTVTSRLDATTIGAGETVQLTISIDEAHKGREPDLSELQKDFRVLGRQFASNTRMSGRGISTESRWVYNLLPLRKGTLSIPAISIDGVTSAPIRLNVKEPKAPDAAASQQVVFLDAQVDNNEVHVQQQVVFTLRLYKRTDLHDPSLVMPEVEGAVQEKLGEPRSFTTTVDGREYEVIENRFAYFPQKSGTLLIPPAELKATIASGGNAFLDPFLGTLGRQIQRTSRAIEVKVLPKPADYPPNAAWLPTSSLKLLETLTPEQQSVAVGEPVTRTIQIQAAGAVPSLLPALPVPGDEGFKVYPEKAASKRSINANGVTGTRVETQTFIPTRPGTLVLPAVELAFWNVHTRKLDKAVIPERKLVVTGDTPAASPVAPVTAVSSTDQPPLSPAVAPVATSSGFWPWLTAAFALAWLATAAGWFISRRNRPRRFAAVAKPPTRNDRISVRRAGVIAACAENNPVLAKKSLLEWFRLIEREHRTLTLGDVARHALSALLANAARDLEQALYHPGSDATWNGDDLRKAIADEDSQRRIKQQATTPALQPLHPQT